MRAELKPDEAVSYTRKDKYADSAQNTYSTGEIDLELESMASRWTDFTGLGFLMCRMECGGKAVKRVVNRSSRYLLLYI